MSLVKAWTLSLIPVKRSDHFSQEFLLMKSKFTITDGKGIGRNGPFAVIRRCSRLAIRGPGIDLGSESRISLNSLLWSCRSQTILRTLASVHASILSTWIIWWHLKYGKPTWNKFYYDIPGVRTQKCSIEECLQRPLVRCDVSSSRSPSEVELVLK